MESETKDAINRLRDTSIGAAALLNALADGTELDESAREALRLVAASLDHAAFDVEEF